MKPHRSLYADHERLILNAFLNSNGNTKDEERRRRKSERLGLELSEQNGISTMDLDKGDQSALKYGDRQCFIRLYHEAPVRAHLLRNSVYTFLPK